MMNMLLLVCVLGALLLALTVDVAALISWLKATCRRLNRHMEIGR
jgi:hypothetical protein